MTNALIITCFILFICVAFLLFLLILSNKEHKIEKLEKENEQKKKDSDILSVTIKEQKKTDELLEKTNGTCTDADFLNTVDLLHVTAQKGKQRNKTN